MSQGFSQDMQIENTKKMNIRHFPSKFFRELNCFQKHYDRQVKRRIRQQEERVLKLQEFQQNKKRLAETLEAVQIVRDGNRIKGSWKNNQPHGKIVIEYFDGSYFEGNYQNGYRTYGIFKFTDGHIYQGNFLCNQFNGQGTLTYPNGKIISGCWLQGNIEGNATINYLNGDIYFGPVFDLKKHGKGYMFFHNGTKYIGNFQHGQISGFGSLYKENNQLINQGIWQKGRFIKAETQQQLYQQQ